MMIKKLTRVGNSNALTIDKAIMELIGLEEGGEVMITIDHGSLRVTPVGKSRPDPEAFEETLRNVVEKRRELLKRLAK